MTINTLQKVSMSARWRAGELADELWEKHYTIYGLSVCRGTDLFRCKQGRSTIACHSWLDEVVPLESTCRNLCQRSALLRQ